MEDFLERNDVIKRIKKALQKRSGRTWSVTGGRGTAYGWIKISSPPKRMENWYMPESDRKELGDLLGLSKPVHQQGESIPSSNAYYQEYIDRAEGREPTRIGTPYWD